MPRLLPGLGLGAAPLLGLATAAAAWAAPPVPRPASLPPHGQPGECYARVIKPAVYGSEARQVLDKPGWTETRVVPAVTETVVEQVVVKPEVVERIWRDAVYRDEVSWDEIPGPSQWVHEPPRYQQVRETVLVEPGRYEWQRTFNGFGEVWCKVFVPPRQAVVERQVMVSPGRDYQVQGPPTRRQVIRKALVSEGGWSERRTPAVYRSETRVRVVVPERTERIDHPARYRTEAVPVLVTPEGEDWVRVTCQKAAEAPPPPPPRAPPPPPARPYGERG